MKKQLTNLRRAFRSDFRSVAWDLLRAVPLRAARLATVTEAHGPVELRWVSFALLALLALVWPAHGADLDLLGQWPGWPRGTAGGVAVSGNYAYVADGGAGLQVIDVSDPANPQRVGGYDTSGNANGVAVSGNYGYVADGGAGLMVINVSNPANPQRVGGYDTSGDARDVAVSGNYAYLAVGGEWTGSSYVGSLQVIDVSDPANPQRVGRYVTGKLARGVAVSGNYAYVADQVAGLLVIDVSNPANPQRVGGYNTGGYGVVLSRNYAYVADGGLQVIDVSNPASPQWVSGYNTSGSAVGVVLNGNYAYVADSPWGLMILGPRTPRITSIARAVGTATVYYTNTIPGTNYTLEFRTNLTTGTWRSVGTQPAPGDSASQTDSAAPGDQRYYRVSYGP